MHFWPGCPSIWRRGCQNDGLLFLFTVGLTKNQEHDIINSRYTRRRPTPKRECGKILTLLYEAWLCFLTLLVEGLPLKFNTGRCVCKFDTVTPEPKLVKIGHVTRKCITTCSLYVNVSLRQVTKCLNDVNATYIPEPWGSGAFSFFGLLHFNSCEGLYQALFAVCLLLVGRMRRAKRNIPHP